jgi:hypothetical protein
VGEVPPLTKLYEKYQPSGFAFFIVYVREAHPGENYPHHESIEQKFEHAKKLRTLENINKIPILIDDIQGTMHKTIDREGTVAYKSDWSDAEEMDGMCATLLRLDEMKARQIPIIRQGISERLHWIPMDPAMRERIYRRSGEKAIQDYLNVKGNLPYATDAERKKSEKR